MRSSRGHREGIIWSLSDGRLRACHVGTPNVALAIDELALIRMAFSSSPLQREDRRDLRGVHFDETIALTRWNVQSPNTGRGMRRCVGGMDPVVTGQSVAALRYGYGLSDLFTR